MSDIQPIEKLITTISTGKKRLYQSALNNLLYYLQDALQWIIPEAKQTTLRDTNYEWFTSMASGSQHAKQLFELYQSQKAHYLSKRGTPSPILITLMIGFEIAPLSLGHISQILNNSDSIRTDMPSLCLRVHHLTPSKDGTPVPFTHYHLPLLAYRLLNDYYAQSASKLSTVDLYQLLKNWLNTHKLPAITQSTWSLRFQLSWYVRHRLPPIFIKDLAIAERHVSLPTEYKASCIKQDEIYKIDWDLKWFAQLTQSTTNTDWPHRNLISSHYSSKIKPTAPEVNLNNLLPRLLYEYTEQLLTSGGVKKNRLASSTIKKYTSLENELGSHPLSHADASNVDDANRWAQAIYDSITVDATRQTFIYFLRFLNVHELTDGIDLSLFSSPTIPPSVSPGRLDLGQLDKLINTLITSNSTNPFRSLFAVIATLLGFFGMLRRGEVLRLRRRDLEFSPTTGLLSLTIMNTAEGRTKNGQSRCVYTTIPQSYRELFEVFLEIKANAENDAPLLGFEGEKYHSRQLYYLLPITRALRMHFGTHINFHHLRHSGVHLLMVQALHFFSDTPPDLRGESPIELEVMSNEAIATRFDYWLEQRKPKDVNVGILIDEICGQIGHTHYATTRWSYLHDIDWLLPIISTAHQGFIKRHYTHAELCYLFNLSPKSNDLSRRLKALSSDYAQKSLGEKRNQLITLTDTELRVEILKKSAKIISSTPFKHYINWKNSINTSRETILGFLFQSMLDQKTLDFTELSQIWSLGCQHDFHPINKTQQTALRNLPKICLSDQKDCLQFNIACNSKNADNFRNAFRHKQWEWLNVDFVLNANNKLDHTRQMLIIKNNYLENKENVDIKKHPKGETSLTIKLTPKYPLSKQTLNFILQFVNSLQSIKDIAS
ncbi:site-specific integrase [Shewanella sp. SNU WT4]|uniref:site-specific integrase n=1 Tax=Shewanella sp. SNU WT4 TaxID=2590015 RepID=UPI001125E796|nr:site-specific integrase [Shewanella sp. SNU WT4]QDF67628.1 site-specific integrase [Shewanella sp. SNU WT4]